MGEAIHTAHRCQVEWQDGTDVLTLGHERAHAPFDHPGGVRRLRQHPRSVVAAPVRGSPTGDI